LEIVVNYCTSDNCRFNRTFREADAKSNAEAFARAKVQYGCKWADVYDMETGEYLLAVRPNKIQKYGTN